MSNREPDPGGFDAAESKPTSKRAKAEQVPPAALDLERAIVACCLCDAEAIETAKRHMEPLDCYDDRHRYALQAAFAVHTATGRADVLLTFDWLTEHDRAKDVSLDYLAGLASAVGHPDMIGGYARKVRECRIMREMLTAAHLIMERGYSPACDPEAFAEYAERLMGRVEAIRQAKQFADEASMPSLGADLADLADAIERGEPDGKVMPTGFAKLDDLLHGGARGGQLVVIVGRPGEGKTTLALNVTRNWCENGKRVLFVSLEMQRRELYLKLASAIAGTDISRKGNPWDAGRRQQAFVALSDWRLRIHDTASQTIDNILHWVNDMHAIEPCDAIVIDNMQDVFHNPRDRLHEAIGLCARKFKQLAKQFDVPLLLLAQASRDIEGRGLDADYRMSDVADSKGIEAAADVVLFCWRPNDGDMRLPDGYREWQIAKNRSGDTGAIRCDFDGEAATWRESAHARISRRSDDGGTKMRVVRGGKYQPRNRADVDG